MDVILAYEGESYRLLERQAEVVAEHLITESGTGVARALARRIESACVDSILRVVSVTRAEAEPLREVLTGMQPPEGFPDADFQRLRAAVCIW
jgi:hypothetical protein